MEDAPVFHLRQLWVAGSFIKREGRGIRLMGLGDVYMRVDSYLENTKLSTEGHAQIFCFVYNSPVMEPS